jgi:branched-subunit amino acid aminotransferase/4-amino-4-deoxychorismate lyase
MKENSFSYIDGVDIHSTSDSANNKIKSLVFNNSAFLWADSVFTSGLVDHGQMTFWNAHRERLCYAYEWQFGLALKDWTLVENQIKKIMKTHLSFCGRFRLTFFYQDSTEKAHWLLTLKPISTVEPLSLKTCTIPFFSHAGGNNSRVKLGNYASFYRLKRLHKSELCWLDKENKVIETSHGNLLFYNSKNKKWVTPISRDLFIEGIGLRRGLNKLEISKEKIALEELSHFSAAYQVNAVYGPVPISKIDDITMPMSNEKLPTLKKIWQEEILHDK